MHYILELGAEIGLFHAPFANSAADIAAIHPGQRFVVMDGPVPAGKQAVPDFAAGSYSLADAPVPDPVLTPAQFEWMLASTGLDDVWAAIEAALKDQDRALYAAIRMQKKMQRFHLDVTRGFIAQVAALAAQVAPGVDLSESRIRSAWAQAARVNAQGEIQP